MCFYSNVHLRGYDFILVNSNTLWKRALFCSASKTMPSQKSLLTRSSRVKVYVVFSSMLLDTCTLCGSIKWGPLLGDYVIKHFIVMYPPQDSELRLRWLTLAKRPVFGSVIRQCPKCITLHLALPVPVLKVHRKVS